MENTSKTFGQFTVGTMLKAESHRKDYRYVVIRQDAKVTVLYAADFGTMFEYENTDSAEGFHIWDAETEYKSQDGYYNVIKPKKQ